MSEQQRATGVTDRRPAESRAADERVSLGAAAGNTYTKIERCVADHPATSMLVALTAGVGAGVAVGLMLGRVPIGRRAAHEDTAEKIGRRLLDAVTNILPDALAERIPR